MQQFLPLPIRRGNTTMSLASYLKKNYRSKNFSISNCLKATNIERRDIAESIFRKMIESILSNKKNDKEFRAWAKAISSAEYASIGLKFNWNENVEKPQQSSRYSLNLNRFITAKANEVLKEASGFRRPRSISLESASHQRSKRLREKQPAVYAQVQESDSSASEFSEAQEPDTRGSRHRGSWLVGQGETENIVVDVDAQWILDGKNISATLRQYREKVVKKVLQKDFPEIDDIL
ncbi:hypothetical protein VTP01DRAFT_90 [Rhizomucor pusillus]|uniref:uncharacterized protein n=1 Tax=Rhizomucor pusillus TaxID=4840 RepID=UPI003744871B